MNVIPRNARGGRSLASFSNFWRVGTFREWSSKILCWGEESLTRFWDDFLGKGAKNQVCNSKNAN